MTTRRDSLLYPQPVPAETGRGVLVDLDASYAPGLLSLIESRKYGASWEDGERWSDGAQYYTELQWRVLMDASDRIISEIRQVRGPKPGQNPLETYDPTETPQYNGTQLFDVLYNSEVGINGVNDKLQVLVDQALAANNEEQLEALQQIIFLLGGAL